MEKFNWKNFTIKDIENKYVYPKRNKPDPTISETFYTTGVNIEFKYLDYTKETNLTISDHLDMNIYKGSENIYIELTIYSEDSDRKLKIWSKDNHELIKNIAKEIISQS